MENFEKQTLASLKQLCKEKGIKGYSTKSKAELIALLMNTQPSIPEVKEVKEVKSKKPKVEKPKVEKPKVEKPQIEKTKVEKPQIEKPKVEKPKVKPKVKAQVQKVEKVNKELNVPTLSHILGFESAAALLTPWLASSPSTAALYGATGIGKTYFAHEFCKALGYTIIEVSPNDLLDHPMVYNRSLKPNCLILVDDTEKVPKFTSKKPIQTHILFVGRDKPAQTAIQGPLIQVRRPTAIQIAKWLVPQFPTYSQAQIQTLADENQSDIRHILQTLQSGFHLQGQGKDQTIDKEANECVAKLYNNSLSFDRRMQYTETDLDIIQCLLQEGVPKATNSLESCLQALEVASQADLTPHQTGRVALTTGIVTPLQPASAPFCFFPAWYGKYSKREKHRKYLTRLHGAKHDLESIPILRARVLEEASALGEQGISISNIAKQVLQMIEKQNLIYDDLFDSYEDCCYEGTELDEFDTPLQKEIKRFSKLSGES